MQHVQAHVPVTALALYGENYILSGEGGYLLLYSIGGSLLSRTLIFDDQAIHGIAVSNNAPVSTAIVWGGPLLRLLSLALIDGVVHVARGEKQHAKDWILDAAFAPASTLRAGLVTAHGAFTTLCIHHTESQPSKCPESTLKPQIPGSNCILYSAHLTWLSASNCLIASGTSFGDIIVWSVVIDDEGNDSTRRQIHFSFSAHDGSVFGVRLSSQSFSPGRDARRLLLVSCSDDRSVRLWNVSDLRSSTVVAHSGQDTGFGSRLKAGGIHAPPCLAKAMGHISRIWHVRLAEARHDNELTRIRSFGEDASVITWAVRIEASAYVMGPVHTIKPHAGKNVWSVATNEMNDLVLTGGADGTIAVCKKDGPVTKFVETPNDKILGSGVRDDFRSYAFVASRMLIATTNGGSLVLITLSNSCGLSGVEQVSAPLPGLISYSLISAIPSVAFIGGTNGTIYLYDNEQRRVFELASVRGKIAGLFVQKQTSGAVVLLVCAVNSIAASIFVLEDGVHGNLRPTPIRELDLELEKGFVTTAFADGVGKEYSYYILGSRTGSVAVYTDHEDTKSTLLHSLLLTDVHGKEAVTQLQWIAGESTAECSERHWLLSTGRDGTVAMHLITLTGDRLGLELVHQLSLPFGPNIEGISISNDTGALVWGFKSKLFVVFDLDVQRKVMAIECGGMHRSWAFQPTTSGGRFVWTKASKLFQTNQSSPAYDQVRLGGHGREIKAASISTEGDEQIIATGAEDTDIKLFTVDGTFIRCVQTLRKHNTGIQHLAWLESHLFSSGGFEEFFVWKTRRNIPTIGVGVVCESTHPRSGTSDLRIMGFDVQQADSPQHFVIAMAYSDSTLKHWRYRCREWELISAADYLTSCLTQVFGTKYDDHVQWSSATDGHIIRWGVDIGKQSVAWTKRHKVHQNSIHQAICVSLGGAESLVVTGGDDNAIGLTRITDSGKMHTCLIPRAHAAAVTGLAILPLQQGGFGLVSAGIDQRIKLWHVELDPTRPDSNGVRVKRLYDVHTAVADVSGVGLCAMRDAGVGVLIYGVGIDVWRLPWGEGSEAPE